MKENFNYGLGYLRALLCFMVVYLHFGHDMREPLHFIGMCAVPCFIMMSFFFTSGRVLEADMRSQARRLLRFVYPLLAWGIISVLLCLAAGDKLTARAVLEQLLLGMPHQDFILANHNFLDFPLWFEGSMIYTSLLLMAGAHCFRKLFPGLSHLCWLVPVMAAALICQYASFVPWDEMTSKYHYVLLTLFFCLPYAGIGLLLARHKLLERLVPLRWKAVLISAAGAAALAAWHAGQPSYMFYYGGLRLMVESLLIFTIFYLSSLKLGGILGQAMMLMSEYSMGIYCVHWLVGSRLMELFPELGQHLDGLGLCALIYAISLAIVLAIGSIKSPYAGRLVR
ncbi:acyltransferase family protein [Selenomonas sp. KH1T6]|uniref:acyltransferase family protein n=1 Tax=Selenomonas sp. KH1T6 TaxID=3158784 RepID=UPI0008A74D55|nr:Peptidoglycan/LPS O-acetylase OafA/YrhL, contains acyltransferase and SGNH-hydrolase domains [Selenomonas ruminantium]